jgi:hypothetical protein
MSRFTRIAVAAVTISSANCGGTDAGPSQATVSIPLGALSDDTGNGASLLHGAGIDLAATQMNQGLVMAGSHIRFDWKRLDSTADPVRAKAAALELINGHKAKGLVTDISADSIAVNMLNYDAAAASIKVPITCFACTSAYINDPNATDPDPVRQAALRDAENWMFRVFINTKFEIFTQIQIALQKGLSGDLNGDGKFKVAIYAQDDAFGRSNAGAAGPAMRALATIPTSTETIYVNSRSDVNSYDWATDLAKLTNDINEETGALNDGKPDAVFSALLPSFATAAVKAFRAGAYTIPIVGTVAVRRSSFLQALGAAAEGVEAECPPLWVPDESGRAFQSAFHTLTGEDPESPASSAYDSAATLMLSALIASASLPNPGDVTPDAIRGALLKLSDPAGEVIRPTPAGYAAAVTAIAAGKTINYKGASGVKFDAAGDNYPVTSHWKVEGGQFKQLESYDCSPANPLCKRLD